VYCYWFVYVRLSHFINKLLLLLLHYTVSQKTTKLWNSI